MKRDRCMQGECQRSERRQPSAISDQLSAFGYRRSGSAIGDPLSATGVQRSAVSGVSGCARRTACGSGLGERVAGASRGARGTGNEDPGVAGQRRDFAGTGKRPHVPVTVDIVAVAGQRTGLRVEDPFAVDLVEGGGGNMVDRVVAIEPGPLGLQQRIDIRLNPARRGMLAHRDDRTPAFALVGADFDREHVGVADF